MTDFFGVEAGAKALFGVEAGAVTEAGGGDTGTPNRVAVAVTTVLNYYDFGNLRQTVSPSIPNEGTGGTLALTPLYVGGSALASIPGEFGESALGCVAQNSSGQLGGRLVSAATTKGESASFSINFWLNFVAPTSYGFEMPIIGKCHSPGSAAYDPTTLVGIYQDGAIQGVIQSAGAVYVSIDGVDPVPLGVWTHVAMTFDGTTITLYMNGVSVATETSAAADWGTHGEWFVLGWPNVTYANSPPAVLSDVRVDSVCLGAADVAAIYATWRNPAL